MVAPVATFNAWLGGVSANEIRVALGPLHPETAELSLVRSPIEKNGYLPLGRPPFDRPVCVHSMGISQKHTWRRCVPFYLCRSALMAMHFPNKAGEGRSKMLL
jgi:hypothetical protein